MKESMISVRYLDDSHFREFTVWIKLNMLLSQIHYFLMVVQHQSGREAFKKAQPVGTQMRTNSLGTYTVWHLSVWDYCLLMSQSEDLNPNVVFQRAWGKMKKSMISKHDTRKVVRNKHNSLIELQGLHSHSWLDDNTRKRQTRIWISRGTGCFICQNSPKQCVFTGL